MKYNKEVFTKLLNMTAKVDGDIVFMTMRSHAKGLMTVDQVHYTTEEMEKLLQIAEEQGKRIRFMPVYDEQEHSNFVLHEEIRIGIRMGMSFDEYVYTLAHELAHCFLHYDKGDTIESVKHEEYEEQANRAAKMLLMALAM